LGKYRGKQAGEERHKKVYILQTGKKPSIKETAEVTDYSCSQVCRIKNLYR